jgi:hypothetical protein
MTHGDGEWALVSMQGWAILGTEGRKNTALDKALTAVTIGPAAKEARGVTAVNTSCSGQSIQNRIIGRGCLALKCRRCRKVCMISSCERSGSHR